MAIIDTNRASYTKPNPNLIVGGHGKEAHSHKPKKQTNPISNDKLRVAGLALEQLERARTARSDTEYKYHLSEAFRLIRDKLKQLT